MEFKIKGEKGEVLKVELSLEMRGKIPILTATDYKGVTWDIMRFADGRFERIEDISGDIGIKVDNIGRIIEENRPF